MSKYFSLIILVLLLFSTQINVSAADYKQQLNIQSEAVVLLDTETGAVLYAKNPEEKLYPASLSKIATAIYAIEKGNLNDIVTVSKNAVNQQGTRVYLDEGEKVTLKKLIQGMLINSGNDAAVAIAEHLDGSVEQFSQNINDYFKNKIGVKNTHFTNPNGLFNPNHYTTAMDLAIITNYAKKNPTFSEIFGTRKLLWNGESWKTTLFTHHRMLKGEIPYPGITGGKTGFVEESKSTLATTADNGKIKLTVIALKGVHQQANYDDTKLLLDFGFKNFMNIMIKKNETFKEGNKEFVAPNDITLTVPINGSMRKVSSEGLLTIENKQGQIIQQVQLQSKQPKKMIKPKHHSTNKINIHINPLYGIVVFAFAGTVIGARKKLKRNV